MELFPQEEVVQHDEPFWNQPLKIDFKGFFLALSKAILNVTLAKWNEALANALEAVVTIKTDRTPPALASVLLKRSMTRAIYDLLKDYIRYFPMKF